MTKKRLFVVLCVLVMLVTMFTMSAYALYSGTACPNCGRTYNLDADPIGSAVWRRTGSTSCGHGTSGVDYIEQFTGKLTCKTCYEKYSGTLYKRVCPMTGITEAIGDVEK